MSGKVISDNSVAVCSNAISFLKPVSQMQPVNVNMVKRRLLQLYSSCDMASCVAVACHAGFAQALRAMLWLATHRWNAYLKIVECPRAKDPD